MDDPRIGMVLSDRYRVVSRLSAGAMGAVYRAERLQLGRAVAVKFLHAAFSREPEFMRRFDNEARAMSRLSHPHCVSVIDFGVADVPYVVMDYVAGTTLRDLLEKGRLPTQRALVIAHQVLAGLAHAHKQGVVHRDIKPANVMLTEATGTGDHVRILDFGLAKLVTADVSQMSATAPMAIGTPSYMSPEQARGDTVDARSDVYGAGVLLYELLTGEKPFVADEAFAIIRLQLEEKAPRLRDKAPDVAWSAELEAVVARALAKKPADRFDTAAEFADTLARVPEAQNLFNRRLSSELAPPPLRDDDTDADAGADGSTDRTRPAPPPRRPTTGPAGRSGGADAEPSRPTGARRSAVLVAMLLLALATGAALLLRDRRPWEQRAEAPTARGFAAAAADGADAGPAGAESAPSAALGGPLADAASVLPIARPETDPAATGGGTGPAPGAEADAGALAEAVPGEPGDDEEVLELDPGDGEPEPTPEPEPAPTATAPTEVRTIRDVERLIREGDKAGAYRALVTMRRQYPKNAYINYLLGNLQFERLYYSDGLESYLVAVTNNSDYKKNIRVNENAIRALAVNKTYGKAVALFMKIGRPALPYLDRAAKNDRSKVVRQRAAAVAAKLRKKK